MTMRTIFTTITFNRPFRLSGSDLEQPAGNYEIETDEELIEDMSFLGYRRMSTLIHLHRQENRPGITEMMTIDPIELEAVIATDRITDQANGSIEPEVLTS